MSAELIRSERELIVPVARTGPIAMRLATIGDMPVLDALQKNHSRALGFFPRAQMQGYVENGWILIAEDARTGGLLGYCASRDRYLKRDELGVVYQLCVAPGDQRKLVGASLMRAVFERSAYGCRLFCCWCAQDLEANYFWEALGFVPIAFRAGSTRKKRVHIFWQKRIVDGDVETKWWYPFKTDNGSIRADRIVLPIPPGVHWSAVSAVSVPLVPDEKKQLTNDDQPKQLPAPREKRAVKKTGNGPMAGKVGILVSGRIKYVPKPGYVEPPAAKGKRAKREKRELMKVDPKYLADVRELRDRYLERINDRLLLSATTGATTTAGEKYHIGKALDDTRVSTRRARGMLLAG